MPYFQKKFPFSPVELFSEDEEKRLRIRVARMRPLFSIVTMLQFIGLPFLYGKLLNGIYLLLYHYIIVPPNLFFPVDPGIFVFPGFFLVLCHLNTSAKLLFRTIGIKDYEKMYQYFQMQKGYNNDKVFSYVSKTAFYVFVVTCIMGMTARIVALPDKIKINNVTSLRPITCSYKDIKKINWIVRHIDSTGETIRYACNFLLANGETFSTEFFLQDNNMPSDPPLIKLLLRKGITADTTYFHEK